MATGVRAASWPLFSASAGCSLAAAGALLSAGSWPVHASPLFGIPWGNLVAAVMIASPSLGALALIRRGRMLWPARIAAGLAVAWLPASMAMAGNIYLNDFGPMYDVFRAYSAFCVLLPVLLLLAWPLDAMIARRAENRRQ